MLAMEMPNDGNIIPTIQLFEYGKKASHEPDCPIVLSDWCNSENTNGRHITARPNIFIVLLIVRLKFMIYITYIDMLLKKSVDICQIKYESDAYNILYKCVLAYPNPTTNMFYTNCHLIP